MRHAGPTRREIGVRTAFNLLGPITNPAGARRQVVGVGDLAAAPRLAEVLRALGTERSLVVNGAGLDELPLDGSGVVHDVSPAGVERRTVDPAALGLVRAGTAELSGGTPAQSAAIVENVLAGADRGPRRDVVLLNAAAAFVAAGRAAGLAEGVVLAAATIDDGAATGLLGRLRRRRPPPTRPCRGPRRRPEVPHDPPAASASARRHAPAAHPRSRGRAGVLERSPLAARRLARSSVRRPIAARPGRRRSTLPARRRGPPAARASISSRGEALVASPARST